MPDHSLPPSACRTVIRSNHAVITEETRVDSILPGWSARNWVQIGPGMGAAFSQILVDADSSSQIHHTGDDHQIFVFIVRGGCHLQVGSLRESLRGEHFAWIPPGTNFHADQFQRETRLLIFRKRYVPSSASKAPDPLFGQLNTVTSSIFANDPLLGMQLLLPDNLQFDMAINVFTYQPGATLPIVESHVMEHGLLMLDGQGLYMLDQSWYPVKAGDSIWMGPWCPQWFAVVGTRPARYIYYKDVNRFPA